MPAKKDTSAEEKKVAKKVTTTAAKKATPAAKVEAKTAPKKTAATSVKKAPAAEKKVAPAVKAVESTKTKEALATSKGKKRKLQIEDKFNGRKYYLGVGKRKSATALVRMHEEGKGKIFINNIDIESYFFGILIEDALQGLTLSGKEKDFDITIKVTGGGVCSQSGAVRHGIVRALVEFDASLRPVLKKAGLLTRDARRKERKKPGLKGARRAPQWRKR